MAFRATSVSFASSTARCPRAYAFSRWRTIAKPALKAISVEGSTAAPASTAARTRGALLGVVEPDNGPLATIVRGTPVGGLYVHDVVEFINREELARYDLSGIEMGPHGLRDLLRALLERPDAIKGQVTIDLSENPLSGVTVADLCVLGQVLEGHPRLNVVLGASIPLRSLMEALGQDFLNNLVRAGQIQVQLPCKRPTVAALQEEVAALRQRLQAHDRAVAREVVDAVYSAYGMDGYHFVGRNLSLVDGRGIDAVLAPRYYNRAAIVVQAGVDVDSGLQWLEQEGKSKVKYLEQLCKTPYDLLTETQLADYQALGVAKYADAELFVLAMGGLEMSEESIERMGDSGHIVVSLDEYGGRFQVKPHMWAIKGPDEAFWERWEEEALL